MKKIIIFLIFILGMALIFWDKINFVPLRVEEKPSAVVIAQKKQPDIEKKVIKEVTNSLGNHFDSYLKSLPTIDDLQNLTEDEVHYTPELVKDGGEIIGRIHEEADADPRKRVDALNFLKKCVEDDQLVLAMRAVCLNKVYKLIPEWKIPAPLSDLHIPDDVLDLAIKLD